MTDRTDTGDGAPQVPDVFTALRMAAAEMPSIGKDRSAPGLKYKFRSIEQLTQHAAGLFAKWGIVIVPYGSTMDYVDVTTDKGAKMVEARGRFEWRIQGPGGPEDFYVGATFGEARDTSDKAANKAHTAAYKYLLMTILNISDNKEDPDFERPGDSASSSQGGVLDEPEFDDERYAAIMAEAKAGRDEFGDEWAGVLREKAQAEGFESVNDWVAADLAGSEAFITRHKLQGRFAKEQAQIKEEAKPEPAPKRTRAKVGSAVAETTAEQMEEEAQAHARAVIERHFPGAEDVTEDQLDLD